MSKKHITTDELAVMVNKGFGGVDKRFDEVDKRFDEVDKRFDEVTGIMARQKNLEEVRERVENIEKLLMKQHTFQLQNHEKRLKHIEDLLAVIGER